MLFSTPDGPGEYTKVPERLERGQARFFICWEVRDNPVRDNCVWTYWHLNMNELSWTWMNMSFHSDPRNCTNWTIEMALAKISQVPKLRTSKFTTLDRLFGSNTAALAGRGAWFGRKTADHSGDICRCHAFMPVLRGRPARGP